MSRVAVAAVLLLCVGCAGTNDYLAWQVKYARSIPDPQGRAAAMAAVARSAAYADDSSTLNAALRDLAGDPRHDEAAADAALYYGQAGKPDAARRVAKKITDPAKRDEVLGKLAELTAAPPANTTPACPPAGPPAPTSSPPPTGPSPTSSGPP